MKGRTDFTLVELLVVISIIALLASMLLPVLGKARDNAKSMRCLGQVNQCSLSLLQYAGDNQDYRPAAYSPSSGFYWAGALLSGKYVSGRAADSMFLCPQGPPAAFVAPYNKCYGMMRDAPYRGSTETISSQTPYKTSQSIWPSEDILLGDSIRTNPDPVGQVYVMYKFFNVSNTFQLHARHLNSANVSFYDGHAAGMTLGKIKALRTYKVAPPVGFTDYCVIKASMLPETWPAP